MGHDFLSIVPAISIKCNEVKIATTIHNLINKNR